MTESTRQDRLMEGKQVLVVDDDPVQTMVLSQMIAKSGGRVIRSHDSKSVPDILKVNHVDLVILDIMMPAPDGWEIFRWMREIPPYRSIPVIFLTALVREDEQETFNRKTDPCRVLAKPVERESLFLAIEELLPV